MLNIKEANAIMNPFEILVASLHVTEYVDVVKALQLFEVQQLIDLTYVSADP